MKLRSLPRRLRRLASSRLASLKAAASVIDGMVEACDARELTGWAYRPDSPNTPVMVELWVGDQPVQVRKADLPRQDIAARLGTRGHHGFEFRIDTLGLAEHDIHGSTLLSVRLAHRDATLRSAARFHRPSPFAYDAQRFGTFAFAHGLTADTLFFDAADIREFHRRKTQAPFSQILERLRVRVAEARAAGVARLAEEPLGGRGFLWRNTLQDAALVAVLDADPDLLAFTDELIGFLCTHPEAPGAYLPNEVALGFASMGLVMALDLTAAAGVTLHNRAAALDFLDRAGDFLKRRQSRDPWGRRSRERLIWNHAPIAYALLGNAALMNGVRSEKHAAWLAEASWRAQGFVRHGIDDAGMTREGISYCGFTLGLFGPFLRALFRAYPVRHYFHSAPGCAEAKWERMIEWFRFDGAPAGGMLGAWNDSRSEPYHAARALLHLPAPSLALQAAEQWHELLGEDGTASFGDAPNYRHALLFDSYVFLSPDRNPRRDLPLNRYYPTDGYLHARSSWARDAVSFAFKCGPHTDGIHGQSDTNAFTLTSSGRPFLIDSGTANDPAPGSKSQWQWHNVVAVNGKGQRLSGRGLGVSGVIVERDIGSRHLYVAGDATASYETGVTRAVRHILFAWAPMPFVVVHDEVDAEGGVDLVEWYFRVDGRFGGFRAPAPDRYVFRADRREAALLHFAAPTEHAAPPSKPQRPNNLYRFKRPQSTPFVVLPFQGRVPSMSLEASHQGDHVEIRAGIAGRQLRIRFATGPHLGYFGAHEAQPWGPVFQILE